MKSIINFSILLFMTTSMIYATNYKVLTLNVKNAFSKASLLAIKKVFNTKKIQPDFVLLQEMKFRKQGQSTVADFAKELGYSFFTELKRKEDSEGLGILSKHAIISDPKTQTPHSWSLNLSARSSYTRIALFTDFNVPQLGRVRVINTHLAHKKDKTTAIIRRKQVEEIMNWLIAKQKEIPADVLFFGGDFNSNRSESFYQGDLEAITQVPIAKSVFFADNNGSNKTSDDDRRIDFIFSVSTGSNIISFRNEEILFQDKISLGKKKQVKVSDHRAVLHSYSLAPAIVKSETKEKEEKKTLAKL